MILLDSVAAKAPPTSIYNLFPLNTTDYNGLQLTNQ